MKAAAGIGEGQGPPPERARQWKLILGGGCGSSSCWSAVPAQEGSPLQFNVLTVLGSRGYIFSLAQQLGNPFEPKKIAGVNKLQWRGAKWAD